MKILQKNESGQALLLVLLSMAVVLTIVLYILSRSITDVAVTTSDEASLRAFSAAEAGVERALVIGSVGSTSIGDASFTVNAIDFAAGSKEFSYPVTLNSGDTATLWFVGHDAATGSLICDATNPCFSGSKVKVCWGSLGTSSGSGTTPAIEMSFVYAATPGDYSTLNVARAVVDPYAGRRSVNSFASPDAGTCQIGGESYEFQKTLDLSTLGVTSAGSDNGLQFATLRMLYNSDAAQKIGFSVDFPGNDLLPSQGTMVESTGTSGQSTRRVEVFQGWGEVPAIFGSVFFGQNGVTK